jgi:signal transduction histidine kinase
MDTIPECRQQANTADTRSAVQSRYTATRAIPALATHNGAAADTAKAGETEERSDRALAKPASDIGGATSGKLAASIAHEINQPLATIVINDGVCLHWLDHEMPDLAQARSAVNQIVSDASRAWETVRRLRALSRNADPEYRPLNINDLVTETTPRLRREIVRHGAALRLDLHSDVPPVAGDKVQLQQVVINLVVNGIQAMAGTIGRESSLTIRSRRRRGDGVLVSIIDNGAGIDPRHLERLFDAFFTTKPTGMGLSICRSIIEAHGGEVGASNNQGFGAARRHNWQLTSASQLGGGRGC